MCSTHRALSTNPAPGLFRFEVAAANDPGVWNNSGAATTVVVVPALDRLTWDKTSGAIVILGLVLGGLYCLRVRQTAAVQKRLLAQMKERERVARELHDTLLQDFQ